MNRLLPPFQDLARGAACAVRAALRRAALTGAALLIGALGAAFGVLAVFLGLSLVMGSALAALTMGAALLATAAVLGLIAREAGRTTHPVTPPPQANRDTSPPTAANTATIAVFTAAFLLGRRLTNRRGSSNNS